MPTKEEIKANKAEAKALRKTLTEINRTNLKECAQLRKIINQHTIKLREKEHAHNQYVAKVNRRLAILEGRNNA